MTRTLEEMKKERGGYCHNCGKDIMDPKETDHTFCNDCWYLMLAHPFEEDEDGPFCANCGEEKNSPYHSILPDDV